MLDCANEYRNSCNRKMLLVTELASLLVEKVQKSVHDRKEEEEIPGHQESHVVEGQGTGPASS